MINYLLDPFIQIENNNGHPVVGAKIYVYFTGSRTVAPIYSDKEGTELVNPAITDTLGNVTLFAETGIFYDVLVYDNDDTLLFSKINVTPSDSTAADVHEVEVEAGFGIQVQKHYQGNKAIYNVAIDPDETATQADVSGKQDKLIAGDNIEITPTNTINVVQRRTLYTQWPLKADRSSNILKLYLDDDYSNDFKTVQESASYGGSGKYISEISQNENGEINATVLTMPTVPTYTAGSGISIDNNIISCTGDITPYTAGSGISINDHQISCMGDVTPYSAGNGIAINDHVISTTATKHTGRRSEAGTDTLSYDIGDKFSILFRFDPTEKKVYTEIRNDNTDARNFYALVNKGEKTLIGTNSVVTVRTTTWDYDVFDLDLLFMGVGDSLPVCSFTIAVQAYEMYDIFTVYDKILG